MTANAAGGGTRRARRWARVVAGLWLAGAVVTWNTVFDARIDRGARAFVARQQAFIEERGPAADMDQAMNEARADGVRAAWGWTTLELAPGLLLAAAWRFSARRGTAGPPGDPR